MERMERLEGVEDEIFFYYISFLILRKEGFVWGGVMLRRGVPLVLSTAWD